MSKTLNCVLLCLLLCFSKNINATDRLDFLADYEYVNKIYNAEEEGDQPSDSPIFAFYFYAYSEHILIDKRTDILKTIKYLDDQKRYKDDGFQFFYIIKSYYLDNYVSNFPDIKEVINFIPEPQDLVQNKLVYLQLKQENNIMLEITYTEFIDKICSEREDIFILIKKIKRGDLMSYLVNYESNIPISSNEISQSCFESIDGMLFADICIDISYSTYIIEGYCDLEEEKQNLGTLIKRERHFVGREQQFQINSDKFICFVNKTNLDDVDTTTIPAKYYKYSPSHFFYRNYNSNIHEKFFCVSMKNENPTDWSLTANNIPEKNEPITEFNNFFKQDAYKIAKSYKYVIKHNIIESGDQLLQGIYILSSAFKRFFIELEVELFYKDIFESHPFYFIVEEEDLDNNNIMKTIRHIRKLENSNIELEKINFQYNSDTNEFVFDKQTENKIKNFLHNVNSGFNNEIREKEYNNKLLSDCLFRKLTVITGRIYKGKINDLDQKTTKEIIEAISTEVEKNSFMKRQSKFIANCKNRSSRVVDIKKGKNFNIFGMVFDEYSIYKNEVRIFEDSEILETQSVFPPFGTSLINKVEFNDSESYFICFTANPRFNNAKKNTIDDKIRNIDIVSCLDEKLKLRQGEEQVSAGIQTVRRFILPILIAKIHDIIISIESTIKKEDSDYIIDDFADCKNLIYEKILEQITGNNTDLFGEALKPIFSAIICNLINHATKILFEGFKYNLEVSIILDSKKQPEYKEELINSIRRVQELKEED